MRRWSWCRLWEAARGNRRRTFFEQLGAGVELGELLPALLAQLLEGDHLRACRRKDAVIHGVARCVLAEKRGRAAGRWGEGRRARLIGEVHGRGRHRERPGGRRERRAGGPAGKLLPGRRGGVPRLRRRPRGRGAFGLRLRRGDSPEIEQTTEPREMSAVRVGGEGARGRGSERRRRAERRPIPSHRRPTPGRSLARAPETPWSGRCGAAATAARRRRRRRTRRAEAAPRPSRRGRRRRTRCAARWLWRGVAVRAGRAQSSGRSRGGGGRAAGGSPTPPWGGLPLSRRRWLLAGRMRAES